MTHFRAYFLGETMTDEISISVIEDNSVVKKLSKTTKKLDKKYNHKRTLDELKINKKYSPARKLFSGMFTTILAFLVVFSVLLCFSCLYGKITKTIPTFGGYSFMQIVTGSMTAEEFEYNGTTYASGHKRGEKIVIRSVDARTLKEGDKIAFYVYADSFNEFYSGEREKVLELPQNVEYKVTVPQFFGVQTKEVTTASKSKCKLVFHHIIEVYELDGKRWFRTQGSSNNSPDNWVVKEDYVIGIYDDSKLGGIVSSTLGFITSTAGKITMILVPLLLLAGMIIFDFYRNAERAKLELDCVEEKRKITDPICIKLGIGYGMTKKTKYKILAQANTEDWNEYISLLWKNGKAPKIVKKYAIRKNLLLVPMRKKLALNRMCELKYRLGEPIEGIAKYYIQEKQNIKVYEKRLNKKLKAIKGVVKNEKAS